MEHDVTNSRCLGGHFLGSTGGLLANGKAFGHPDIVDSFEPVNALKVSAQDSPLPTTTTINMRLSAGLPTCVRVFDIWMQVLGKYTARSATEKMW